MEITAMSTFTDNILACYGQANYNDIEQGKNWYKTANTIAIELSQLHNLPIEVIAGVIAALSPNNKWTNNIVDASAILTGIANGKSFHEIKTFAYSANKIKAWLIASTLDTSYLKGKKVNAFMKNILLDASLVCIDGHAWNIANNERKPLRNGCPNLNSCGRYELAVKAYQEVAEMLNMPAYELQAITWVTWRRINGIA